MKYLLNRRYRFRGWHGAPYGIYDTKAHSVLFFDEALYRLLMRCDAVQEIETEKPGEMYICDWSSDVCSSDLRRTACFSLTKRSTGS